MLEKQHFFCQGAGAFWYLCGYFMVRPWWTDYCPKLQTTPCWSPDSKSSLRWTMCAFMSSAPSGRMWAKSWTKAKGWGELCWVLGSSVFCLMLSVSQSKCSLWMLACFAEYCLFGSFFSGSGARISEQCVHPHVQHQCAKPAVRADQLYGQTGRWDLLFLTVPLFIFCHDVELSLCGERSHWSDVFVFSQTQGLESSQTECK